MQDWRPRVAERTPDNPPSGRRAPACRLALPASAAAELASKLTKLLNALNKPAAARAIAPETAPAGE